MSIEPAVFSSSRAKIMMMREIEGKSKTTRDNLKKIPFTVFASQLFKSKP